MTATPAAPRTAPGPASPGVVVDEATLAAIVAAHEAGRALDAWALAAPLGPLSRWSGAPALVVAGRIAPHLGAPRLSEALHHRAARADPDDEQARRYAARAVLHRRGPAAAWELVEAARTALRGLDDSADWLALRGSILAEARDFDAARPLIERALRLAPDDPWPWVERAHLEERMDRVEAALEAARSALAIRPAYRPAVQAVARELDLLGRREEALEALGAPAADLQSCLLDAQRASLLHELGRSEDALAAWDAFVRAAPLLDDEGRRMVEGARADACFRGGLVARAVVHARAAGPPRTALADHAEAHPDGRRVELAMPFLRQDHDGCAPASLAMACAAVGLQVDPRAIAAEVCHGGTPVHADRVWAERRGLLARELTLTWDAARALIDRGVPLVVGTLDPTSGHAQVVRGYDARLGLFVVQDPSLPGTCEALVEPFLDRYRASGPRALVVLPPALADRLAGLELPDAALRDLRHALQRALAEHDRAAAVAALERLRAAAADHRLTLQAERDLAAYDGDGAARLAVVRRLRALDPDEPALLVDELVALSEVGARSERMALLEEATRRPWADPIFPVFLARELLADGSPALERVRRLARRAARRKPADPAVLALEAELRWEEGRRAGALLRWRMASCLAETDERRLEVWLRAGRALGREDEVLAVARARVERQGDRSGRPARVLARALEEGGDAAGALAALEDGLRRRPDDGDLLLEAAEARARRGDGPGAAALLARAEGRARPVDIRRAAARVAGHGGEPAAALALWREVVAAAPADREAHEAVAGLLARLEGPRAGAAHMAAAAAAFPHDVPLARARVAWSRQADPTGAEAALADAVARHPTDAWLRRELALELVDQRRLEEAIAAADEGVRLEPWSPGSHGIRGQALLAAGRDDEAQAAFRACLERDLDTPHAVRGLAQSARGPALRDALGWVAELLTVRAVEGAGARAWLEACVDADPALVPPEVVEGWVDGLVAARPEGAWPWSLRGLLRQLRGDLAGAAKAAEEAAERAPLSTAVWFDLALVRERQKDAPGRRAALERALAAAPGAPVALRRLALALLDEAEAAPAPDAKLVERARSLLERAAAAAPLDARTQAALARARAVAGEREAALAGLQRAVTLDPGLEEAWLALARLGTPEGGLAAARAAVAARPHDPHAWARLAERLAPGDEALRAAARAVELGPRLLQLHDLHAELLARAGRFDEAAAACDPPALRRDGPRPLELRGRAVWVRALAGDVAGAVRDMAALLKEAPDYAWGQRTLVEWHRELDHPDYLASAERLVALEPERPMAHALLGDAALRQAEKARRDGLTGAVAPRVAQGRAALERALALEPRYPFPAELLVDLALAERPRRPAAIEAAQRALEEAAPGAPWTLARRAAVAAALGDRDRALAALGRLLPACEAPRGALELAVEALGEAGFARPCRDALEAAAQDPAAPSPHAGAVLVALDVGAGRWHLASAFVERTLARSKEPGEAARRAALEYLDAVARHGWVEEARRLERVVGPRLRGDVTLWGALGTALRTGGDAATTARWLEGAPRRAGVEPWILFDLAMALRALGRDAEAAAASRAALELPPDGSTRAHQAWLALDRAAERVAGGAAPAPRPGGWAGLRLVEALAPALAAAVAGAALSETRAAFARALAECPELGRTPELRRAWRRAAWRAGRAVGGLVALLWAVWTVLVVGRAR